jgi:hypothetical protein
VRVALAIAGASCWLVFADQPAKLIPASLVRGQSQLCRDGSTRTGSGSTLPLSLSNGSNHLRRRSQNFARERLGQIGERVALFGLQHFSKGVHRRVRFREVSLGLSSFLNSSPGVRLDARSHRCLLIPSPVIVYCGASSGRGRHGSAVGAVSTDFASGLFSEAAPRKVNVLRLRRHLLLPTCCLGAAAMVAGSA